MKLVDKILEDNEDHEDHWDAVQNGEIDPDIGRVYQVTLIEGQVVEVALVDIVMRGAATEFWTTNGKDLLFTGYYPDYTSDGMKFDEPWCDAEQLLVDDSKGFRPTDKKMDVSQFGEASWTDDY